jgi:hypothetical protein
MPKFDPMTGVPDWKAGFLELAAQKASYITS